MALDVLSIPALNCECERMFSELGDLLEPTVADLTSVYSAYGGSIGFILIRVVLPSQLSFSSRRFLGAERF